MTTIASECLSADIAWLGAELQNLRDASGRSLQWDGDPAVWSGRAPILFPIVGRLQDDRYRVAGRDYAMSRHGFGRRSQFETIAHDASSATLRLDANAETRAIYPFEFRLDIAFALIGATLRMTATIANRGQGPMPTSFGFHPALRWPLPFGATRADHRLVFAHDEPGPVRRLDTDGLLSPVDHPSPVEGVALALRDELFIDDALIFEHPTSRRVTYGASRGPTITIGFDDFPTLGVWTKPGADFICIEPWHGHADPVGYAGDFFHKPGSFVIAAGDARSLTMTITLDDR